MQKPVHNTKLVADLEKLLIRGELLLEAGKLKIQKGHTILSKKS